MRLSSEECPVCGGGRCNGEAQENGDHIFAHYECPDCDTEFGFLFRADPDDVEILKEGKLSEDEE